MTHAGFWVDGAVRKPEARHRDRNNWIVANWKDTGNDLDICQPNFDEWDKVYWLDTTSRESLTPEELFSVVKIVCPSVIKIDRHDVGPATFSIDDINDVYIPINWGNITQYPPPSEPQWIRITRENVGQYLFRECRTQKNDITYAGRVVGWCIEDDCCLVESDYKTEEPILQWDHVEVKT